MPETSSATSFGETRVHVEDLFHVRPGIYWLDLSLCMLVGWGSFAAALRTPWALAPLKMAWLVISTFAFFRGLIFIHELAHIAPLRTMAFRWVWNGFCGMFFFVPDYTYLPHAFHHRTATFSTKDDPEYVPVAYQKPLEILAPFIIFPFVPLILAVRFLVVGPLSLILGGRLREWVLRHASTMKMNPAFVWTTISDEDRRQAAWQDVLCLAWWIFFLVACRGMGWLNVLGDWYLLVWGVFVVNHVRSLARHRYINASGERVSYEAQLLDSVTVQGFSPLAWIFMPVGLRYHSIHHMFPTLPYYALGTAHRRLVQQLPPDHLYRKTLVTSFSAALFNLFKTIRSVY